MQFRAVAVQERSGFGLAKKKAKKKSGAKHPGNRTRRDRRQGNSRAKPSREPPSDEELERLRKLWDHVT